MTEPQAISLAYLITQLVPACGLHGDCIGADADFNALMRAWAMPTYCHPCTLKNQRAFTDAIQLSAPRAPLMRNRFIVDECTVMIGAPGGMQEELRSGTWSTIRYARSRSKKLIVVYPDGSIVDETDKISF